MFSLLVKFSDWNPEGSDSIDVTRVLEYTEDGVRGQFINQGQIDFSALKQLPALFMPETPGTSGSEQMARVAQITKVRQSGDEVQISYAFDNSIPPIANQTMIEILSSAGALQRHERMRTHWAVKDADLYACIARALFRRRLQPKIFELRNELDTQQRLISVMMPFSAEFEPVHETIKNAVTSAGLRCLRADDIWESESIMQDVVDLIVKSDAVIADCTDLNPNVFYEMGIAHTVGRPVIPLVQARRDIPFDISHLRNIRYFPNRQGLEDLGDLILNRLASLGLSS